MAGLGQTVSELMLKRMGDAAMRPRFAASESPLVAAEFAGSNPGQLKMMTLVPPGLPRGAPLVVVLHGCSQTAAAYDFGSGWSSLARRHGFALLYAEQPSSNNPNGCFNWFQTEDTTRDRGEVASIAQMIRHMVTTHGLDAARVYVTGLSAGGAMTAAMLATYPELFAGGAVIAGLPFGVASNVSSALEAMRHVRSRPAAEWGALVRQASPHRGARPPVQIWHGAADATVNHVAMEELVKQWCDVAAVQGPPQRNDIDGTAHQVWRAPNGAVAVESYLVPQMGHGVSLNSEASDFDESVGTPSAYMLDMGISSTRRIAHSWGLLTQAPSNRSQPNRSQPPRHDTAAKPIGGLDVNGLIQGVLRRAGLNK